MKIFTNTVLAAAVFLAGVLATTEARAAYTTFSCTPQTVQFVVTSVGGEPRVALSCTAAAPGGIVWFAYRFWDGAEQSKLLFSSFLAAKTAGRSVTIGYESTDTSGANWGCEAANCRIVKKIELN